MSKKKDDPSKSPFPFNLLLSPSLLLLSLDITSFRSDIYSILTTIQAIESRNSFIFYLLCCINCINLTCLVIYPYLQLWSSYYPFYCHILLILTIGYYLGCPPKVSNLYLDMMNRGLKQFGLSVHYSDGKFHLKGHKFHPPSSDHQNTSNPSSPSDR